MSAASSQPPKSRRGDRLLAAALLAATVAPFVAVPIPPMTDLPQHVLVGQILNHFDDPGFGFRNAFALDPGFRPLVVPHLLLAALQRIAGPLGGAKLYLALFVLFTYLATAWLLAAARVARPVLIATAVLPLCLSGLVYMGFLPFVMSFPLYALLLAVWLRRAPSPRRSALAAALLLLLFICHLVGAVVGAFAIFVLSALRVWRRKEGLAALSLDLAALVPVSFAVLWFVVLQEHPSDLSLRFNAPLAALKAFLAYNVRTLADPASVLNALGLTALAATALRCVLRGDSDERLWLLTLALVGVGLAAPIAVGILWPAGPRLFPFAYLTALTLLHLRPRGATIFAVAIAAVVTLQSASLVQRSLEIGRDYERFLSGTSSVTTGSRILPIVDTLFDRSGPILPFWSAASLYVVERGGSHPYVFARPYWKTGGDFIRYLDYPRYTHSFLYEEPVAPERYRGASQSYDFVVVWNGGPGLDAVLGEEFALVHEAPPLRVYGPAPDRR